MSAGAARARLAEILGGEALERLEGRTVAIVGVGVVGGFAALHLGLLPLRLLLIDPGRVELENLSNQLLPAATLGAGKAHARVRQIRAHRPDAEVVPIASRLEDLGLGRLAGADVLVTAPDTASTRIHAAVIAKRLGIAMVDGAVSGAAKSLGSVSVYPPGPHAACFACRLRPEDLARIEREERPRPCGGWRPLPAAGPPTLESSAFGSVVAGLLVLEVLRVLGAGVRLRAASRLLVSEAGGGTRHEVPAEPICTFPHVALEPLARSGAAGPQALVAQVEREAGEPVVAIHLHERSLVAGLACPRCGQVRDLVRAPGAIRSADLRCSCGADEERRPEQLVGSLDRSLVERLAGRSWSSLGLPPCDVVTVETASGRLAHHVVGRDPGTPAAAAPGEVRPS